MSLSLARHFNEKLSPSWLTVNYPEYKPRQRLAQLAIAIIEDPQKILIRESQFPQRSKLLLYKLQTLHEVRDIVRKCFKGCEFDGSVTNPNQKLIEILANRLICFNISFVKCLKSQSDGCIEIIKTDLRRECFTVSDQLMLKGNH